MAQLTGSVTPWPEDMMKQYKWLDACLQKQPATEVVFQPAWQAYKYMLSGKMYALIGINDQNGRPMLTLKLDPLHSDLLRQQYQDIVPGYYMNKVNWSTVYLDGAVPQDVIEGMVSASHHVVLSSLPKKMQREILESYVT
ncbi:MmcQ/YjbR family DNA-binding protein [Eubacteriales bacterium OttesenSCG-928-N13]|nr:MmcQ/YjbR family DNA-binding protein [Eubacteriales bacterium OttesenSCG-928-N13]